MASSGAGKVRVILVHGGCHGAWCWYKLKPLLEAAGHGVTAVDMAGAGVDSTDIRDLASFEHYSRPLTDLMAAIPPGEKAVLVGHSYGGESVSLAMDAFPDKIHVAIFVTALISGSVLKLLAESKPEEFMDSTITPVENRSNPEAQITSLLLGPNYLAHNLYHLSPPQDIALAKMLVRPCPIFSGEKMAREKGFASVKRAYIVCGRDKTIPLTFQRWLIQTFGADRVIEMNDSDHMPMISDPLLLSRHLLQIISAYC
ncbi:acetone-cyanohydrin lyase [Genlisea aurea]|uniref:Acetone-cyanohydrin lyase n=1 Tax=Genlisea aurea TaxID=192259 RepID=S8D8K0_9LAMI|nr:acetone-cyanohydrin lyase [Genlisea aurea]